MKAYIHARLGTRERLALEKLRKKTGESDSALVRRGLQLVVEQERGGQSALDLAGRSVGRFRKGARDLATNRRHLDDFGA